jgi:hypothetical protein
MKPSFLKKTTGLIRTKIKQYLQVSYEWLSTTPERALLEAYQAAHRIKSIEIEQFHGQRISPESANYTDNVMAYWLIFLQKNLTIIKVKLAEFRLSSSITKISNPDFLEKLKFIDEVAFNYILKKETILLDEIKSVSQPLQITHNEVNEKPNSFQIDDVKKNPIFQKKGIFPRTIGRTINKIKADFSPRAEEKFLRDFQVSKKRTRTAVRFLVMLVLVPTLTQYFSSQFLLSPIVEKIRGEEPSQIFLNHEMEEQALYELKNFENKLKFENLIHQTPPISSEILEEKVKSKVREIAQKFREKSSHAISNIFADVMSFGAFALIIAKSKREILIVKSFIDDVIYGLSDSAKAFLIILFTDIFVGFHSPHGWEVILEGFAQHLGLPATRNAIFLFIATFPVILNTIFKYWIFRYLSRLSPSALATLKEMDD